LDSEKKANPEIITEKIPSEGSKTEIAIKPPAKNITKEDIKRMEYELDQQLRNPTELPTFDLKDLNFSIKKGECVAFIGKIGAGKSSILTSLFGELYDLDQKGRVDYKTDIGQPQINVNGSVAYVSQNTWVRSITLKENILFYNEYDEKRYNDAIYYSCLTDDLKQFSDGDNTMLGDKGINLSGGQKVR